jgi:hypothetical protein
MIAKLILASILLATIAVPMRAARIARPKRAFRKLVVWSLMFNFAYLFFVLYVYPRVL